MSALSLRDQLALGASEEDVKAHRENRDLPKEVTGATSMNGCDWVETWGYPQRTREEARYHFADAMLEAREGV